MKSILRVSCLRIGSFATILAAAVILPGTANAAPALVTQTLNVRTGPGPLFGRVGTLPAGIRVDVGNCRGRWCEVWGGGYTGWASANFLRFGNYARQRYYPYAEPRSTTIFSMQFGSGGYRSQRRAEWYERDYPQPYSVRRSYYDPYADDRGRPPIGFGVSPSPFFD